jgi:hypothetical protein
MEYIGYSFEEPKKQTHKGKETGKWLPIELIFDNDDDFNKATSKVEKIFHGYDGDGKAIISIYQDSSIKYIVDLIHVTYDTYANSIKLFPKYCERTKN